MNRMQRAQKNVQKMQTEKSSGLKEKSDQLREQAKQRRKEQALMHQAKIDEVLEKEEAWHQRKMEKTKVVKIVMKEMLREL